MFLLKLDPVVASFFTSLWTGLGLVGVRFWRDQKLQSHDQKANELRCIIQSLMVLQLLRVASSCFICLSQAFSRNQIRILVLPGDPAEDVQLRPELQLHQIITSIIWRVVSDSSFPPSALGFPLIFSLC